MNPIARTELKNAKNMKEFFDVLCRHYDMENCKPGMIVKETMIAKIPSIVTLVQAKEKRP